MFEEHLWRETTSSTIYFRFRRSRVMVESEQDEAQAIDPILRAEVSRIWREWIGMDPDLSVGSGRLRSTRRLCG
ncbi:hypothetical protein GS491_26590 [Rhodococcus hoagii]|nr:hypothetical protein [Prescottella equi]